MCMKKFDVDFIYFILFFFFTDLPDFFNLVIFRQLHLVNNG